MMLRQDFLFSKTPMPQLSWAQSKIFEYLREKLSDALLICLTFPRYCQQTLDITEQFQKAEAKIIAITDSHVSPLAQVGNYVFPLPY